MTTTISRGTLIRWLLALVVLSVLFWGVRQLFSDKDLSDATHNIQTYTIPQHGIIFRYDAEQYSVRKMSNISFIVAHRGDQQTATTQLNKPELVITILPPDTSLAAELSMFNERIEPAGLKDVYITKQNDTDLEISFTRPSGITFKEKYTRFDTGTVVHTSYNNIQHATAFEGIINSMEEHSIVRNLQAYTILQYGITLQYEPERYRVRKDSDSSFAVVYRDGQETPLVEYAKPELTIVILPHTSLDVELAKFEGRIVSDQLEDVKIKQQENGNIKLSYLVGFGITYHETYIQISNEMLVRTSYYNAAHSREFEAIIGSISSI